MSYNRGPSPPTRRLDPRFADAVADAYHSHRHNSSVLPRSSNERVIPLSTQTYVTGGPSSSSGAGRSTTSGYDAYPSRSGRHSPIESSRTAGRSRTSVHHGESARTASPVRDDRGYYVVPSSSRSEKDSKHAQKVYVTDSRGARLISEEIVPDGSRPERHRHHKHRSRADSEDRDTNRGSVSYGGSRRSVDDADAFSYTDPAGMFRDTEPTWRPRESRARRGSMDRSGGDDSYASSRKSRDYGPPVTTRGFDRINDGLGRTKSMREGPREVDPSPHRGRDDDRYDDPRDPYYIAPRRGSVTRQEAPRDRKDIDERDERFEPRRERRLSAHKPQDRSVSRRGFGIRPESKDRQTIRRSDESLDSYGRDDYTSTRRDYASDNERSSKRHSKHDSHDRRDRDYSPDDSDRERHQRTRDHDRRRRDDGRDDRATDAALAAGGLAAGAAALHGMSRGADDTTGRTRANDEPRGPRNEHLDREPERRKSSKPANAPYPDEKDDIADRGFGFAFEGSGLPDRTRTDLKADTSRDASQDNRRVLERTHEDMPPALSGNAPIDPDEEYRQRIQQAQRELGITGSAPDDADRERRRRERESRLHSRREHLSTSDAVAGAGHDDRSPMRASFDSSRAPSSTGDAPPPSRPELQRRSSVVDDVMPPDMGAVILDNSQSEQRETRVRIVDPPTEEEERKPKGILKRPTEKFPDHPNTVREGVAPLKDATKKGIPPGARWTKIDRRLVNPQALEDAKERYEERQDCVIVLRVLTKEEIQKLADRTKAIREKRFDEEDRSKRDSRHHDRDRDRRDRDEYSDDSADEWDHDKRPVRMLEAAPPASDHSERRDR